MDNRSLKKLEAVLDTVIDGIITINGQGIIESFNPSAERIFGYKAQDVIGQNVKMLMPDPYRSEHDTYIKNHLDSGESKIIGIGREVQAQRKDGTIFDIELGISRVNIEGEHLFVGTVRDISDRKFAEDLMVASEARMRAIVDNTADGLITIDERGKVETFNKACKEIFGYEPDEVVGRNVKMLMPNPYHREHDNYLRNYHNTGEKKIIGIDREVRGRHKDGSTFPVDLSVSEMNVRGRKIYSGIVRDISARKEKEAELISVGRLLEESLNEVFIFKADTLNFIQVNRGARENLGYSMEELSMMTPLDIKPDYTEDQYIEILEPLKSGYKEKLVFETRHERRDGTLYNVEVHIQYTTYRNRMVYVANILDVTERKIAEEEIKRSNNELERFAYICSHDLQEPARMMESFSEILSADYSDRFDDAGKEYLNIIFKNARNMQKMIQDILTYARVGRENLEFENINTDEIVANILEEINDDITAKNAMIEVSRLPVLYSSHTLVSALLHNLITNALKYQDGRETPHIKISAEDKKECWQFNLQDNGIGIDPQYEERVFEMFQRIHSKDEYPGTGIGLSTCKKFIELYNGKIWFDSEFGKGTIFHFTIPKKQEDQKHA